MWQWQVLSRGHDPVGERRFPQSCWGFERRQTFYLARLSSTTKRSTSRASTPGVRAAVANSDLDFR